MNADNIYRTLAFILWNTALFSIVIWVITNIFLNSSEMASVISCGVCFVLGIILLISSECITHELEKRDYTYSTEPTTIEHITALSDNSEINGKIRGGRYAVRGYINEKLYYSYMVKLSNGGMKANKISADETTIYEVGDNFRVEWYTAHRELLGISEEYTYWKMYVPEGSVTNEFNVDLE